MITIAVTGRTGNTLYACWKDRKTGVVAFREREIRRGAWRYPPDMVPFPDREFAQEQADEWQRTLPTDKVGRIPKYRVVEIPK